MLKREYAEYKAGREHSVGNGNAHQNDAHEADRVEDARTDIAHRTKPQAEVIRACIQ